jgi:hypothetical protein
LLINRIKATGADGDDIAYSLMAQMPNAVLLASEGWNTALKKARDSLLEFLAYQASQPFLAGKVDRFAEAREQAFEDLPLE